MIYFKLICYIMFIYGVSVIVTNGIGPFDIFFRLRKWADEVSDNFGLLFRCMLCFPTNAGIICSLLNWFFVPVALTPFNIILNGTELWWLAAIMDGALSGGACIILWHIDDHIDKTTPIFEDE